MASELADEENPPPGPGCMLGPSVLALSLVVIYAAQAWTTAPGTVGLVRWGALHPDTLADRSWWRLASASLIHVNGLHVAMNALFVGALGSQVARVIGGSRTLVVFFGGGLAGAYAHAAWTPGVAAGASGGAWGLMCALILLTYSAALRRGQDAPDTLRSLLELLLLNLLVSLLPSVAMTIHVAGGVGGAVALLLTHPRAPTVWRAVAGGLALAHVVALGVAVAMGRPWSPLPPLGEVVQREIAYGMAQIQVPEGLQVVQRGRTTEIGDPLRDGVGVWVRLSDGFDLAPVKTRVGDSELTRTGPPTDGCATWSGSSNGWTMMRRLCRIEEYDLEALFAVTEERANTRSAIDGWTQSLALSADARTWVEQDTLMTVFAARSKVQHWEGLLIDYPSASVMSSLASELLSAHLAPGDRRRAVTLAQQALEIEPDEPYIEQILSRGLEAVGDLEGALEHQRRAAEILPQDEGMATRLAELEALAGTVAQ